MRDNAVAPRHQPARDRGRAALYPVGAGDDRADDRARRWAASRMGPIATATGHRIGDSRYAGMGCSLDADANPRIYLDSLLLVRIVGELFTGNVTVMRQRAKRSDRRNA